MFRPITPRTTLDNLKKEAKAWLKALREADPAARERLERAMPTAPAVPGLRDVQRALALEFGCSGWTALKDRLDQDAPLRRYDRVAEALVTAYATGDDVSMRIVWEYFGHMRAWDGMRRYIRLELGKREQPESGDDEGVTIAEARYLVARAQGFESWQVLEVYTTTLPPKTNLAERFVAVFTRSQGAASEPLRSRDWDQVLDAMLERRLTALQAGGQMTDALLERVSRVAHITELDLEGSKALTDDGLRHLARLPNLRRLNLSGCGRITDAGLEAFRRMPALESISLAGTRVTDAGIRPLGACDRLQALDLGGTATGDGPILALAGKPHFREFRSGHGVTDAGIARLHDLPVFKTWHGFDPELWLTQFVPEASFLMLRGPFTDRGLAHLAGLDGLFGLNVDSSQLSITGAGLAPLVDLPHFAWLAFDADDESMPYIARLPHLRFLMCQDTAAGDDGFSALSRSRTIEYIWGRRCHNLQRRGFTAMADMPALRALSVSCLNVDDVGLSALPRFPALSELMPMDVADEGYRYIAQCERLDSLVLMYCRETSDRATAHLRGLAHLRKYFVSYNNRITDRTPEILSGMDTLEAITFDTCAGLTNRGVAALARLPALRELRVSGMPRVTSEVVAAFPARVAVSHSL
jgi:hypothetical protein